MTALEKWENDFKEFISELSIPRDDYKGIMEYINEVPNEALEQQPCEDWYDVPSDEMTLEQARQAVKDLRKKLAEYLEKNRENLINQRATTCRHGGHCEWVACDKCNHYEPDVLNQQPCDDYISRAKAIEEADKLCLETDYDNEQVIEMLNDLPSVTPKEKTGHWVNAKVGKLFPSNDYKCSECGNLLDFDGINCGRGDANYCPNCGARMIEPQESEG